MRRPKKNRKSKEFNKWNEKRREREENKYRVISMSGEG